MQLLFKSFISLFILFAISCDSKDKELIAFSKDFAEKAHANQIDSLISFYPVLENIDSISVAGYNPQNIQITKGKEGIYMVNLSPAVSIDVKYEKGKPVVVDSKGLLVYPENIYAVAKDLNIFDHGESDLSIYAIVQEKVVPYINFTTPDLSFFNLKGHVKTMQWDNTPNYEFCSTPWQNFWGWSGNYEFNESGEWVNAKKIRMSPYASIVNVNRNLENQINKIFYPGEFGYDEDLNYKWEGNTLESFNAPGSRGEFNYENNLITKIEYQYSNTDFMVPANIVISDFQFDEVGNWVSCKFVKTSKEGKRRIAGDIIRKIEYYPLK